MRMQSFSLMIAGVDEVGRGPLAGPVYAAAVILNPHSKIHGLADSKLLTRERREELDAQIRAGAIAWSLGVATVEEIDRINILQASLLAMQRAVAVLSCAPCLVLVDGNRCPQLGRPSAAIIKGDQRVNAISAASIVAKVARDQQMRALDLLYPDYGFAGHKGYPTPAHLHALQTLGVSPIHRRTFAPVRQLISAGFQAAPFCAELHS